MFLFADRTNCGANRLMRDDCEICKISVKGGGICEALTTMKLPRAVSVEQGLVATTGDNYETL